MFVINNFFRDYGPKFIYDYGALKHMLERFGFIEIKQDELGMSGDINLRDIGSHCKIGEFKRLGHV